jgi:hypothetical protein
MGDNHTLRERINLYGGKVIGAVAPTLATRAALSGMDNDIAAWAVSLGVNLIFWKDRSYNPPKRRTLVERSVEFFSVMGQYYAMQEAVRRMYAGELPPTYTLENVLEKHPE